MATQEQFDSLLQSVERAGHFGGNIQGDGTTEPERKYDATILAASKARAGVTGLKHDLLQLIGNISPGEPLERRVADLPLAKIVRSIAVDCGQEPVTLELMATMLAEYIDGVK